MEQYIYNSKLPSFVTGSKMKKLHQSWEYIAAKKTSEA